jgi:UDP-GlcNAc:undecaprenyl-phosphate/decaprenyl-phosphate GlcNAc-1-phosphate transferase
MTFLPMLAGVAAAVGSYMATPLVIHWARARGLYCMPGDRRVHREPLPRLGGVAILAGATVGLGAAVLAGGWDLMAGEAMPPATRILLGMVAAGGIVFAAGLVDDLRGMRPFTKLATQVAAALLVFWLGFRIDVISLGSSELILGWAALPITLLWIVGVTNAYNLVDGMDGLATGMGVIAFTAIVAAAGVLGHGEIVVVGAVLLGALAGFLPHNFNPARIFMGDSGSLFIGFILAVLSVQGSMKSATAVLVVVPLFALAIPLLDTFAAILRRWLRGLPISSADARHIHHRLVARGFSHRDAVLVLYLCAVGFASLGIILAFAPPNTVLLIAVVGGLGSALVLAVGMRGLGYDEFLLAGKVIASGPRRARRVIRDRILASDLAAVIQVAGSMEEVQAVLADAADDLGLLHMEVCAQGSAVAGDTLAFGPPGSFWKMDFPLCSEVCNADPPVLRLLARVADDLRPNNTERVAHTLGEALRERFDLVSAGCECGAPAGWRADMAAAPRARVASA